MTYFTYRWWPPFRYLHRLIQEGYLGQPIFSEIRYVGQYGRTPKYQWKWDRRRGLGTMGDLGSLPASSNNGFPFAPYGY